MRFAERSSWSLARWRTAVASCLLASIWVVTGAGDVGAAPLVSEGAKASGRVAVSPIVAAASDCARLIRFGGRDVIVNTCGECRNVQVLRSRGGSGLPDLRTFRIEGKSRFDLPYKGPGNTRISSDEACAPGSAGQRRDDRAVAAATAQCIVVARVARGYVVLNRCPACRETIMRWKYADGGEKNYPLTIEARKSVALPKGAETGLSVAHEEACQG